MRFWQSLIYTEPSQLQEVARHAEGLGYTGVVLPDHVALPERAESSYPYSEYELDPAAPFLDPWPAITAMGAVTSRLLFSTYVYILPMRDPFSVAKSVATAAILTGGRVALGLGVGWLREEVELLGHPWAARGRRTDEMIEILRQLWRTGTAELHGAHYDFERAHAQPTPGHEIPLYVGGHTDAAIRRAAGCDGWMGLDFPMEEIPGVVAKVRQARVAAGRADEPFEIFLSQQGPPEDDTFRRLEDLGVTSVLLPAFALLPGDHESLDAKRRQMDAFAKRFLQA